MMKVFNTDGSTLLEVKTIERAGNNIEFRGTVMGSMPMKGRLTPQEARNALKMLKPLSLKFFLLTFLFRK